MTKKNLLKKALKEFNIDSLVIKGDTLVELEVALQSLSVYSEAYSQLQQSAIAGGVSKLLQQEKDNPMSKDLIKDYSEATETLNSLKAAVSKASEAERPKLEEKLNNIEALHNEKFGDLIISNPQLLNIISSVNMDDLEKKVKLKTNITKFERQAYQIVRDYFYISEEADQDLFISVVEAVISDPRNSIQKFLGFFVEKGSLKERILDSVNKA